MNRSSRLYVWLVGAAALLFIGSVSWTELTALGLYDIAGLASFIILAVLSEALAIDFTVGPEGHARSSIAFLPLLACTVVFPKAGAIVAVATVLLFEEFASEHRIPWKFAFNISQGVLAIGFAGTVYELLGGEHAPTSSDALGLNFLAFGGLVSAFFVTNVVVVALFYALRERTAIRETAGVIVSAGGNMLFGLLASPIAVIAALLYKELYIGGLVLITLPLLLVRYSYLSKSRLERANRDLLTVLIKAIETRDPYTSGHSVRVSRLAKAVASDLRLPRRKISQIETAALLHDIGKIDASYAKIIGKETVLTEGERSIIQAHATRGADLLQGLASFGDAVIDGVRYHHERFDGTGYPDGRVGDSIPLAARIIAICDAVDAMLSDRPYRPALSLDDVREELLRCAGSHFDPAIVQVILRNDTLDRALELVGQTRYDERSVESPALT